MKAALLIVDMLDDFIHGPLKTEEAWATVQPSAQVLEIFRKYGMPVFFLNDSHIATDYEIKIWGAHAMKGSSGSAIISELEPKGGEYVIEKHAYSGFFGTALDYLLRCLNIDTVILIGLDADICVRHTAADAFFMGYNIVVIRNAVAARIDKNWEPYFKRVYGATIIGSDGLEKLLLA